MTAAELRALLAKATPGKWGWGDFDNCDLPFLPLNTAGSLDAYGPKNQHGESASTAVMWLGRDHGLKPKDAALIVALRNAAEQFAEMLEEREAENTYVWVSSHPLPGRTFRKNGTYAGQVWPYSSDMWCWCVRDYLEHGTSSTEAEARAAVEAAVRAAK